MSRTTLRSPLRVAGVSALILLVPLVAMQFTDEVNWSPFDFGLAAVLLVGSGCLLELSLRNTASVAYRATILVVGVAAVTLGEVDDAPGLVLFGFLLIAAMVALTIKTARRSALSQQR